MKKAFFLLPSDMLSFLGSLWRTPEMASLWNERESLGSFMRKRLEERPFWLAFPSHPAEESHASFLWGHCLLRERATPELFDLALLHEISHWACADLSPSPDFDSWARRWDETEFSASVISEALVHFQLPPDFCMRAFGRKLWIHSFFPDGALPKALFNPFEPATWPQEAQGALTSRRRLREGASPALSADERWIAGFPALNRAWEATWRDSWREPDRLLGEYRIALLDGSIKRAKNTLAESARAQAIDGVPYFTQALSFHKARAQFIDQQNKPLPQPRGAPHGP